MVERGMGNPHAILPNPECIRIELLRSVIEPRSQSMLNFTVVHPAVRLSLLCLTPGSAGKRWRSGGARQEKCKFRWASLQSHAISHHTAARHRLNPRLLLHQLPLLPAGLTRSLYRSLPLLRRSLSSSVCTHSLPISTLPRSADVAEGCSCSHA